MCIQPNESAETISSKNSKLNRGKSRNSVTFNKHVTKNKNSNNAERRKKTSRAQISNNQVKGSRRSHSPESEQRKRKAPVEDRREVRIRSRSNSPNTDVKASNRAKSPKHDHGQTLDDSRENTKAKKVSPKHDHGQTVDDSRENTKVKKVFRTFNHQEIVNPTLVNDQQVYKLPKLFRINKNNTPASENKQQAPQVRQVNQKKNNTTKGTDYKVPQNVPIPSSSGSNHTNPVKMMLRKQAWRMSKPVIKRNKRLSDLLAQNRVDIDKIRIDKLDLSLIDVDQLGIENKALKNSIIWLLK